MSSSATCPVCDAPQAHGLLCHACTTRLERDLGDVPSIAAELDTTLARQARLGDGGKTGVLPHHRDGYHPGASHAAGVLTNTLTTWARDICDNQLPPAPGKPPVVVAAWALLANIPAIRRHPAVDELVDEITDAIRQARHAVDRPSDRQFVGPCMAMLEGATCTEDLYARPHAATVTCRVCGIEHDVAERRAWLLDTARDRLFTVREAAQMLGDVGGIRVTEDRIRGYLRRDRIAYQPIGDRRGIRLGDLLAVVLADGERDTRAAS